MKFAESFFIARELKNKNGCKYTLNLIIQIISKVLNLKTTQQWDPCTYQTSKHVLNVAFKELSDAFHRTYGSLLSLYTPKASSFSETITKQTFMSQKIPKRQE